MMESCFETDQTVIFTGDVGGVRIGPEAPVMPPCPPPDIHVEDWLSSIQLLRHRPTDLLFLTHYGLISDKEAHLNALESTLKDWAEWIRPFAEQQTPVPEIVPQFEDYVRQQLVEAGVNEEGLERYNKANPAFMSVTGLMRYWKKRVI